MIVQGVKVRTMAVAKAEVREAIRQHGLQLSFGELRELLTILTT